MQTNVIEKSVLDLTNQELRQCRSLTFRGGGTMCEDLTDARYWEKSRKARTKRRARVFLIKEQDKLIAWALVRPHGPRGYAAEFYTRKSERNKGYGTILMNKVLQLTRKPYVYPHDYRSGAFFKKHQKFIKYDPADEWWLKYDARV